MLRVMGAREELEAGAAKVNIFKDHSSPMGNRWVGAGQCPKVNTGRWFWKLLVKLEGSLGEACAVFLCPSVYS